MAQTSTTVTFTCVLDVHVLTVVAAFRSNSLIRVSVHRASTAPTVPTVRQSPLSALCLLTACS